MCSHDAAWANHGIDRIAGVVSANVPEQAALADNGIQLIERTQQIGATPVRFHALIWSPMTRAAQAPARLRQHRHAQRLFGGRHRRVQAEARQPERLCEGPPAERLPVRRRDLRGREPRRDPRRDGRIDLAHRRKQSERRPHPGRGGGKPGQQDPVRCLEQHARIAPAAHPRPRPAGLAPPGPAVHGGQPAAHPRAGRAEHRTPARQRSAAAADSLQRFLELRRRQSGIPRAEAIARLAVVAFTDPNDLLSYRLLPARYAAPDVAVADVLVSNDKTWLGLIENPVAAHLDYLANPDVGDLIACGFPRAPSCR
jgi:hypothetical protein